MSYSARIAVTGMLCLLAACQQIPDPSNLLGRVVGGSTVEMTDVQPAGGFLPNPALLQRGTNGQPTLNYRNPTISLASYQAVMLEPVALWLAPGSQLASVPASQRQAAVNLFYSDLHDALQQHCHLVTAPQPGTLRFRFALVDATLPNASIDTLATYTPYASGVYDAASLVLNNGVGYFAGTATAEGYAVDAGSGTLIWQGVDKRGGTTAAVENTFNTWLDVHHAFEAWSTELVSRLQTLGVCTAQST